MPVHAVPALTLSVPFRLLLSIIALAGATPMEPAGDGAESLGQLLTPVLGKCYGLALRLTRNPADAEDLIQEAALRATRGFAGFAAGTNFKAWFFRILTNCFYEKYRSRSRAGEPADFEELSDLYLYERTAEAGLHGTVPDPAQHLLGQLDREQINGALDRLPEEYRTVSSLYFLDDLSYQEIAEIAGIPVGTVRSRLHRGRRLLQQLLWDAAMEHGLVPNHRAGNL